MILTIDDYMKIKKRYEQEILLYLSEKKSQFEKETGLSVSDIYVLNSNISCIGDSEDRYIISDVKIKTKLSD